MDLISISEWAREQGITTKEAEARLRAVPGALIQAKRKAKRWVNAKAIERTLVENLVTRVDRLEEDRQDHERRIIDLEAKCA